MMSIYPDVTIHSSLDRTKLKEIWKNTDNQASTQVSKQQTNQQTNKQPAKQTNKQTANQPTKQLQLLQKHCSFYLHQPFPG